MDTWRSILGCFFEGSEEVVVLQGEFLGFCLVTHAGVGIERGGTEEGVELLEHLTALEEDGCHAIGLLLTGRGVVIDYLLDDEGEGAPRFADAHAVLGQLGEDMLMKERDVLCLGLYILGGLDGMEISVDEYLSLVEVALVEWAVLRDRFLSGRHFLKPLGMDSRDGYAHTTHIHHKPSVAVDTDDIALEASQFASGDTQEDAVASVVVEGMKEEAYAVGVGRVDTHKGLHLGIRDDGNLSRAAVLAEVGLRKLLLEVGLCVGRLALDEDEAAHGGCFLVLHLMMTSTAVVADGFMDEEALAVSCQLCLITTCFGVVNEEVGPWTFLGLMV